MAHFALQKLHIRPNVLLGISSVNDLIDDKERAFIYGSIIVRTEKEQEEAKKMKRKGGRG